MTSQISRYQLDARLKLIYIVLSKCYELILQWYRVYSTFRPIIVKLAIFLRGSHI